MEIQAEVLFKHDAFGRITEINEPIDLKAPLFFLGRTKEGNVVRFNDNVSDAFKTNILEAIHQNSANLNPLALINAANKFVDVDRLWMGPAYVFPKDFKASSHAIEITNVNKGILQDDFPELLSHWEWRRPCFVIIREGKPVSVCCSARKSAVAAEANVETLEAFRGRGYGVESVNAWAMSIKREGLIPLYSTAWDNFSSQAIARKLKLYCYGMDLHISGK
jgi:hypothetical protein